MFGSFGSSREPQRRQTPDYRFDLSRRLLTDLHRGECCAVVGVGSCGKSRLLMHLTRPETWEYHLGDSAYNHFVVLVACNAWLGDTIWAAYEGITRSLSELLHTGNHPALQAASRELEGMYKAVVDERDLAPKHLMTGLQYLLGGSRLRLTLCFDEFDFVFEQFDAQLFRNLRAIRNQHKYQLTYLVATRRQMPYQRDPSSWADVEEFYELFSDNTYAIGPYEDKDAYEMIVDLERRYEHGLTKPTRQLLVGVTGGHPGFISASFRILEASRQQPSTPHQMEQLLVNEQANAKEAQKIWDSLRQDERAALRRLATSGRTGRDDDAAVAGLIAKGLLRQANPRGGPTFFSPILHAFARRAQED